MKHGSITHDLKRLALALMAVSMVTVLYGRWLHLTNSTIAALTYLFAILVTAAVSALWVAIAASVLALLCLNYFFMPPVGTFTIVDPQNWVALLVFLAVSVVASNLSASVRARAREALGRRDELSRLFDLSRDILLITESASAVTQLAGAIARRFGLEWVGICLPTADGWHIHDAGTRTLTLATSDLGAALHDARGVIEFDARDRTYGGHRQIQSVEHVSVALVPLRLGGRAIGLLGTAGRTIEPGTLDALAGVAAIAVERAQFLEERQAAALAQRSNELKSALLASLGHDLRTPLTAIRVAASNLLARWSNDEERQQQGEIVLMEVERLSGLFQDILDMARIETNSVATEREWVTPAEIVEAAVAQVQHTLHTHRLSIEAEGDWTVQVDPRLTSAALAHVLENAARYSPEGSTVSVASTVSADALRIVVRDEGSGIAALDLAHLFDRFYRGAEARQRSFGTGMGLAITRGLLAVEGGRVWAENAQGGGAQFSIEVPAASRPAVSTMDSL